MLTLWARLMVLRYETVIKYAVGGDKGVQGGPRTTSTICFQSLLAHYAQVNG